MRPARTARRGMTLLEAAAVLAVVAVLLAAVVPGLRATEAEWLAAAADALAGDLQLARGLAVRDNTTYALTLTAGGWKIEHTGAGPAPALPRPPLAGLGAGYEIDLRALVGRSVASAGRSAQTNRRADSVTFTATGGTAAAENTTFWLTLGTGADARSLPVTVSAATGLVTDAPLVRGGPPAAAGS